MMCSPFHETLSLAFCRCGERYPSACPALPYMYQVVIMMTSLQATASISIRRVRIIVGYLLYPGNMPDYDHYDQVKLPACPIQYAEIILELNPVTQEGRPRGGEKPAGCTYLINPNLYTKYELKCRRNVTINTVSVYPNKHTLT